MSAAPMISPGHALGHSWTLLRRRLPLLLLLAALGAALGLGLALTLRPVFDSQAVLIVESEQIPGELAASTVRTGEIEALQIIRQRILSREVLLELANRLHIYPPDAGLNADEKIADLRARIAIVTSGDQMRRNDRDATIVTVGFSAGEARLAAETANALVTLILQQNVEMRTAVARQTLEFFTQEVDRLEQGLSRVGARILAFQEANLEALPDSLEFRRGQQAALQERLVQLEREKTSLRERRARLVTLFEATGQTSFETGAAAARRGSAFGAPGARELAEELAEELAGLRRELARRAAVLAEDNPRLALLRAQIAAAERARAARPAEGGAPGAGPAPETAAREPETEPANGPATEATTGPTTGAAQLASSLYEIQLADLDAQLSYVADQQQSGRAEMARIAATIEQTPGNAVTLAALEREHDNLQEQYNQAVANRARAETGSMIETLARGQRITVVEQAVPPRRPARPNRPLIGLGGLAAGLLLGTALIVLLELTNTAIRRPRELSAGLGIEAFATIPYMVTRRERLRRRGLSLAAALVLLLGVPTTLWYVDRHHLPLQPVLERALERLQLAPLI